MKRYHKQLLDDGGHRLVADLDKETHEALKKIRARDEASIKEAVSASIKSFAKVKARPKP